MYQVDDCNRSTAATLVSAHLLKRVWPSVLTWLMRNISMEDLQEGDAGIFGPEGSS